MQVISWDPLCNPFNTHYIIQLFPGNIEATPKKLIQIKVNGNSSPKTSGLDSPLFIFAVFFSEFYFFLVHLHFLLNIHGGLGVWACGWDLR